VNQLIDDNNEGDEDEDEDNVDYDKRYQILITNSPLTRRLIKCKIKAKDIKNGYSIIYEH
jgi:hypothetical protein